ncbi:hypothetical protein HU675_0006860 [Bradyrhizobium septentrionale]|uniref:hypothetical protein n=1 Tax=Bradyrhizobium septentrionale TaxID=1404411 RepID=UPI001596F47B|nr:hypothetical protein [Bradyrhizobium septentrionale]UGY26486.1 hypothetical protein HU675_0006860 [Bradyrhizobium septentrionale]
MFKTISTPQAIGRAIVRRLIAGTALSPVLFAVHPAVSQTAGNPHELLVSGALYAGKPSTVAVGQTLPTGGIAVADGTYPTVFNNVAVDSNFGVTAPVVIKKYHLEGDRLREIGALTVPADVAVTSFSSKSELSLHLSPDGKAVTFMGYDAAVNELDVSNSNSPSHVDPTNPDTSVHARVVAELGFDGSLHRTKVNVYSGDNGRGAIRANKVNGTQADQYFTVGNAGNGSGTQPVLIVNDTGVQLATPGSDGSDTVVGVQQGTPGSKNGFQFGFSVGQLGFAADKSGKDDNFRGLAISDNTLYVTKGSGSNGINTVYQVGAPGVLPTRDTAAATTFGILPGFPSNPAVNSGANGFYPFGIWFANATTLYVAQEGDGNLADAATSPTAGLQKWVYANGSWSLAYTLQKGLNLGTAYHVKGYPTDPATGGLRNITGRVNRNGTATIFAVTSTVSNSIEPGADPNLVVAITDKVAATALPANEAFDVVVPPAFGMVYRGVSFAPVNCDGDHGRMKDHGRANDDGKDPQDDVCGPTRIAAGH